MGGMDFSQFANMGAGGDNYDDDEEDDEENENENEEDPYQKADKIDVPSDEEANN